MAATLAERMNKSDLTNWAAVRWRTWSLEIKIKIKGRAKEAEWQEVKGLPGRARKEKVASR